MDGVLQGGVGLREGGRDVGGSGGRTLGCCGGWGLRSRGAHFLVVGGEAETGDQRLNRERDQGDEWRGGNARSCVMGNESQG